MIRYVLKRLLWLIPVILGVSIVIFTLLYFVPGDPVSMILGEGYTQEQYDAKAHELFLDRPFLVQLGKFLYDFYIKGDWGTSYIFGTTVRSELLNRIPRTLMLSVITIIMNVSIGIPLGITAATHQNGFIDRFCIFLAMITTSIPNFWFAMILIIIFAINLGVLPSYGIDHWYCYIMPALASGLMGIGGMARQTRSQMLEVIRSDYVVTARSKGVDEHTILYHHALPNALIPIVTGVGTHFARALGGSVVIETCFSIPGVGLYMITAIGQRDYPIVRSCVTIISIFFSFVMILVDLIYAFIDPRIKAQYEGQSKKKVKQNA